MTRDTPNILILHTDQQSSWTLGCYGGTLVPTPHIDRLAREGVRLTNFFTNSAVCTPSRGCFVTGRYPHCHGAFRNDVALNRDEVTFAEVLKHRGYRTGYAGKWHLDGTPRPGWVHPDRAMGFDDARYMFNRGHWKKIEDSPMAGTQPTVHRYAVIGDEQTYATDWLTSKTLGFVQRHREAPFCFMVSFPDPHPPVTVRAPYDAMFDASDMALPASFTHGDLPDWAEALQAGSPFGMDKPDREQRLRQYLAHYCGEVKLIDDSVGRILDALQGQGILDRTIVVFTTDHGDYAGEHGLHAKNHLYESAYRIPMLIRWPQAIPAGTTVEHVMSTVDFQPTLLALAGVGPCGREQGRDGSRLLQGGGGEWDDIAFLHHCTHEQAGAFTRDVELAYVNGGDAILFDRVRDPHQTRNLFSVREHRDTVRSLTARIVEHHQEVGSPAAGWLKEIRP